MKRWLLTLPILLAGMVGLVRADYFLLVINTAPPSDPAKPATAPPNPADFVGVIVETDNQFPLTPAHKAAFERPPFGGNPLPAKYRNYNLHLTRLSPISVVSLFADTGEKPTDVRIRFNVRRIFAQKHDDKKTPLLELAEWALAHGLVDKFVETMDKLALDEKEKATPAVASYVRIKAAVNAKIEVDPESAWVKRLKNANFTEVTSDHYLILHNVLGKKKNDDVKSRLDRFEDAFKTFYYWHAFHGRVLPVPRARLVVIAAGDNENDESNLKDFRTIADGGAGRLAGRRDDGFLGRREGIVYLSMTSREPSFEKLNAFAGKYFEPSKKNVESMLKEKYSQVRPGTPDPWVLALAVKALESNAERLAVSHYASRQLAFASGLLPRYVDVPEWIQSGQGSLFETPMIAPWTCPGAPNCQYLKPCVEVLEKKGDLGDVLKQVVTDGYFHQAEAASEDDYAAALAKARALSWGLTYYLVQRKGNLFNAYCEELDKMPRDLALDEDVVLGCFARAVGAVDANRKVDAKKLSVVAQDWKQFLEEKKNSPEALEQTSIVDALQALVKAYQEKLMPRTP